MPALYASLAYLCMSHRVMALASNATEERYCMITHTQMFHIESNGTCKLNVSRIISYRRGNSGRARYPP
uniref:Secreted protein n=1 Tax=Anguilla anguilla TaxID=7936 RepID=A0A0E9SPZ9_ANGAN